MNFQGKFSTATRRLLTMEYDGVLVPAQMHPGLTVPDRDTKAIIDELAADSRNTLMILSGRDKEHLDLHWSGRNLVLVAEHGAAYKNRSERWATFFEPPNGWIDEMERSLRALVFQFSGSFIERRQYSITWHYGRISDRISTSEIREVIAGIRALPTSEYFKIYQPYQSIELRSRGLSHPAFISTWVGQQKFDFILSIGVDESSFPVFDLSTASIPVKLTTDVIERFTGVLDSQTEVIPFLNALSATAQPKKIGIWPFNLKSHAWFGE
jgi:trehalose 6-phosphate synthase/phosphatase